MPLPVSGPISASDLRGYIKKASNGSISMSSMLLGGPHVSANSQYVTGGGAGVATIPAAGPIKFSQFYGAMKLVVSSYVTAGNYSHSRSGNYQSAYDQTTSILLVGGGGGGGDAGPDSGPGGENWANGGGGGGAGGTLSLTDVSSSGHPASYSITVGAGGSSGINGTGSYIDSSVISGQATGGDAGQGVAGQGAGSNGNGGAAGNNGFPGGLADSFVIDLAQGAGGGGRVSSGAAGSAGGAGGGSITSLEAGVNVGRGGDGGQSFSSTNGANGTNGLGNGGGGASSFGYSSPGPYKSGGSGGDGRVQIKFWQTYENPFI